MVVCICAGKLLKNLTRKGHKESTKSGQVVSCHREAPPCFIHPYLLVGCRGEHPLLVRVSGEVERIGNYQLATVKTGRLDKRQGPEPLHHSISLWCHLQAKRMFARF